MPSPSALTASLGVQHPDTMIQFLLRQLEALQPLSQQALGGCTPSIGDRGTSRATRRELRVAKEPALATQTVVGGAGLPAWPFETEAGGLESEAL